MAGPGDSGTLDCTDSSVPSYRTLISWRGIIGQN
jgi:hypothetical protein